VLREVASDDTEPKPSFVNGGLALREWLMSQSGSHVADHVLLRVSHLCRAGQVV
jgi:hypothetical protein